MPFAPASSMNHFRDLSSNTEAARARALRTQAKDIRLRLAEEMRLLRTARQTLLGARSVVAHLRSWRKTW